MSEKKPRRFIVGLTGGDRYIKIQDVKDESIDVCWLHRSDECEIEEYLNWQVSRMISDDVHQARMSILKALPLESWRKID